MENFELDSYIWMIVVAAIFFILPIVAFYFIRKDGILLKKSSKGSVGSNIVIGSSIIIAVLFVQTLLLGAWSYVIYDKSKSDEPITQLQTQYSNVDSARYIVQKEYNNALAKMDSLTGTNPKFYGELARRKADIDTLSLDIKQELSEENADLSKVKSMIKELNSKIDDLIVQIKHSN